MVEFGCIKNCFYEAFKSDNTFESISFVGSASKKKIYNDIDIIFISKGDLNSEIFLKTLEKIKNFKRYKIFYKYNIKINSEFGPIKYNFKPNDIVFHCMFYDVKSHIKHVIESPFTCYDWERTEVSLKKKISEVFSVNNLMISDFFKSNRNINQFTKNLKKREISCSKFLTKGKKIKLIKFNKKVNNRNIYIFSRNIVFHTVNNFLKFHNGKNKKYKITEIKNFIESKLKTKDADLLNYNFSIKVEQIVSRTISFLKTIKTYINKYDRGLNKILIIRHFKTKYKKEVFIGQRINPNILIKNLNIISKKKKITIYSSPSKRTTQSCKLLYPKNKIIINDLLKEIDYGRVEGLTFASLKDKYPNTFNKMINNKKFSFPGGESQDQLELRVKKFFFEIIKLNKKEIVVCTHNNFIRIILGKILNINKKNYYKIQVPYGKKIRFVVKNKKIYPDFNRVMLYKFLSQII
tara:strand:- start:30610 stop:32001 length:1392 start_codon:yes stop_codon:yes gene_type:complete